MNPKIIAFDVFGTVVQMDGVPIQELKDYISHIRRTPWEALHLPPRWEWLSPYPDSVEGINALRSAGYIVVTLSNAPLGMMTRLSKNAGLQWDTIIPLEMFRVFKPDPRAYLAVCDIFGVERGEVMMVTANKDFGDLEAAQALGMAPMLIRHRAADIESITALHRFLLRTA